MASNSVLLAKNVVVSKLKFAEPKTLKNGSRIVYVNYEGSKLTIQTPVQRLPFGVGDGVWKGEDDKTDKKEDNYKKFDIQTVFDDLDSNPKMKLLHDKMREIEKRIIDEAFEKRISWLQDDFAESRILVEKLFNPIIKLDKDKLTKKVVGKYPPTMKLKLPYDNERDAFSFESQTMDGEPLDFKSVMGNLKGAKARLIIQLVGIYLAGSKYGCTWKVMSGMFDMPKTSQITKFIVDSDDDLAEEEEHNDDDEEDAELVADAVDAALYLNVAPPPAPAAAAPPSNTVDDDDEEEDAEDEEEDEDSEEDEPPPPPPPKKEVKSKAKAAKK